jgi:hypothetical protein
MLHLDSVAGKVLGMGAGDKRFADMNELIDRGKLVGYLGI